MTTLPLDLPPLREGAEEMAREAYIALRAVPDSAMPPWDWRGNELARSRWSDAYTRLLSDLTRDDTRDRWVRWGADDEIARWERVPKRSDEHVNVRYIRAKWSALRDDPEALRAAILAALETK